MVCRGLKSFVWYGLRVVLLLQVTGVFAQESVLYRDSERDFYKMVKEYDQGFYGSCIESATTFIADHPEADFRVLVLEAELYQLKSGLRLEKPGIINEILAFSERHKPGPVSQQAILLVAEDGFDKRQYDEAIQYFRLIDDQVLTPEQQSARSFKLGYCLFVKKDFERAATSFDQTRSNRDKYYYPSNYYYGMCRYFMGDYTEAVQSFERVANSDYYKDYIPYYITQIHFNHKEFERVIGYGNQSISNPTVENKTEIRHLVGQAYFETGDYAAAIPHLEYVEQQSEKLSIDDFYQLGMAYYHTGRFQDAIPILTEIRNETGEKAHYANYYLAQCYLKTGDKASARNSLMNTSKREEVPALATEALFHYGRLCAEAGDDVEAIRVLQTIPSASAHYADAQNTLAGILTNTSDYNLAIRELEAMKSLTPAMKGAYQKVCLFRAEQLIQEGKTAEATELLDKSLKQPVDKTIEARAYFWKGELAHHLSGYNESIKWYNQYFEVAITALSLPPQQDIPVAQYNQGYNYLKISNYTEAQNYFDKSVTGLQSMISTEPTGLIKNQVHPDALLRAGDCAFKRNQYDKANQYYDKSILEKLPGYDYAKYQKAIIKGLQKQPGEKIKLLEQLANEMPSSIWADDALYQAGITYQDDNQSEKAIQSYERVVNQYKQSSPLLVPSLLHLGLISYNSGQFESSLKYYKSIFEYNPEPEASKEAMSAIQEIYVNELDKPDDFFAFASTVPGYTVSGVEKDSILYAAAENHYAQGQYAKAAESFQKYVSGNPTGLYALKAKYLRAESLSLLKQYDEALIGYEMVIDQGQSTYYASSLYKAALIAYNQNEDWSRAYKHYNAYIPVAETNEKAYEAEIGALRCAFRLKKEEDVYAKANQVLGHPRVTDDHRGLTNYYIATTAYENKNLDKALTSFNEVIHYNSADLAAESRYFIASIYNEREETAVAEKLAEEAARANVGYPFWVARSLLLLSDIHFNNGDLLNARAITEAILENFQGDETIMQEATEKLERIKKEEEIQSRIKEAPGDTLELQEKPKKD